MAGVGHNNHHLGNLAAGNQAVGNSPGASVRSPAIVGVTQTMQQVHHGILLASVVPAVGQINIAEHVCAQDFTGDGVGDNPAGESAETKRQARDKQGYSFHKAIIFSKDID